MTNRFHRITREYVPDPPPSQTLWRVMDLAKLETLVRHEGLWFARLDQFGTSYEGSLPSANEMGLLNMFPKPSADWLLKEYDDAVLSSYASCWHAREGEPDPRVWAEFDPTGMGVAIRVDYATLVSQLRTVAPNLNAAPHPGAGPIHVGAVGYVDHSKDTIPETNILEAQFAVRDKWSYQTEVRCLVHTFGGVDPDTAYNRLLPERGPFGPLVVPETKDVSPTGKRWLRGGHLDGRAIVLHVDPQALVREIRTNPRMPPAERERFEQLAHETGLTDRIVDPT